MSVYPRTQKKIWIDYDVYVGGDSPLLVVAGPCVLESEEHARYMAGALLQILDPLDVGFVFKSSFDKANRTSGASYRGVGMEEGRKILDGIRRDLNIPTITDVHLPSQVETVRNFVSMLQVPAFLCRQTDLIEACAWSGLPVNIKKGQFLSPQEMQQIVNKMEDSGSFRMTLCERGVSFGYNTLVSDFRSLDVMSKTTYPVIFDATHSTQSIGGLGTHSGGNREYAPLLARAAVAVGVDGIFAEVHNKPDEALSDAACQLDLPMFEVMIKELLAIRKSLAN